MEIRVIERVLKVNDELALEVRNRLREAGITAINIISAPGSGKTALIERAIPALRDKLRLGVIEGDPDTTRDAERVAALGAPVTQINTSGGCHLEANLVLRALDALPLDELDLIIIENVGNMVCPVNFDLGEMWRAAVVSVPEGHDKPAKYANLFRKTDLVVLNKTDLLPYVDFDMAVFEADLAQLNPGVELLRTSCRSGDGMAAWTAWLERVCGESPARAPG